MRKKTILFIAEVSIFTALGLVLDLLAGVYSGLLWRNGGSMTLAFVPIFIMGYKHGLKGGLLTGLLIGTIQLIWSSYLINFAQVLLDYIIPNVVLGLVGIVSKQVLTSSPLKKNIYICVSVIIVSVLRLASLVASGMLYWSTPFGGSLVYNGTFTLISCVASLIVTIILENTLYKNNLMTE